MVKLLKIDVVVFSTNLRCILKYINLGITFYTNQLTNQPTNSHTEF